ncbi:MAG: MFS transporter [Rhabdochlamydiaceae bacterium]|nr:MFS transporter [Candidatus Amphrikana amoebophyrae]
MAKNFPIRSLLIILILILIDLLADNFIVSLFHIKPLGNISIYLLFGYMFAQVIFAPLQSGVSDFIGRKFSILFSLLITLVCMGIASIYLSTFSIGWLIGLICMKSILGNTVPLALATIADTQNKHYRRSFIGSSTTYALSFVILKLVGNSLGPIRFDIYLSAAVLISIIVVVLMLFDKEDLRPEIVSLLHEKRLIQKEKTFIEKIYHEPASIIRELKKKCMQQALFAYFLWEVSMYSIIIALVDLNLYQGTGLLSISMMGGYIAGVSVIYFIPQLTDSKVIKYGYYISTISLIPYFIFFNIVNNIEIILQICYFLHALGNAFLSPAFMSMIAKEKHPEEQGIAYGLIDSSDNMAFMVGTGLGLSVKIFHLQFIHLACFSFASFLLSWIFLRRFKNGFNSKDGKLSGTK